MKYSILGQAKLLFFLVSANLCADAYAQKVGYQVILTTDSIKKQYGREVVVYPLQKSTYWGFDIENGDIMKVNMTNGNVVRKAYGKQLALGLCSFTYRPLDTLGKNLFNSSDQAIIKFNGDKPLIFDIQKAMDLKLRKSGIKPIGFGIPPRDPLIVGDEVLWGLYNNDVPDGYKTRRFFQLPLFGAFNLKTNKFRFMGTWPDSLKKPNSGPKIALESRLAYHERSKLLYTSISNSPNLFAYSLDGKLLYRSSLPDSLVKKYRMFDSWPILKVDSVDYIDKLRKVARGFETYYQGSVVILGDSLIGCQVQSRETGVLHLYSLNLDYVGTIELDKDIGVFQYQENNVAYFVKYFPDKEVFVTKGLRFSKLDQ